MCSTCVCVWSVASLWKIHTPEAHVSLCQAGDSIVEYYYCIHNLCMPCCALDCSLPLLLHVELVRLSAMRIHYSSDPYRLSPGTTDDDGDASDDVVSLHRSRRSLHKLFSFMLGQWLQRAGRRASPPASHHASDPEKCERSACARRQRRRRRRLCAVCYLLTRPSQPECVRTHFAQESISFLSEWK